jgi:hypothetical protein
MDKEAINRLLHLGRGLCPHEADPKTVGRLEEKWEALCVHCGEPIGAPSGVSWTSTLMPDYTTDKAAYLDYLQWASGEKELWCGFKQYTFKKQFPSWGPYWRYLKWFEAEFDDIILNPEKGTAALALYIESTGVAILKRGGK